MIYFIKTIQKYLTRSYCLIFLSCLLNHSFGQVKKDSLKKIKYLVVPVVFKTPETGWAGGVSGSVSFKSTTRTDTNTRTSVIQLLGIYTQRQQNVQAIDATIYFPKEKYILTQQLSHSRFPENFWGIGPTTKNDYVQRYSFEQFLISSQLKRKIKGHFFAGLITDFQYVFDIHSNTDNGIGVFDTTNFNGKKTGNVLGIGLSGNYDTRNSTFWPTRGVFFQASFTTFNKEFLSSYSFNRYILDLRYYRKILKNHVIAFQLFNYTTVGSTPIRNLGVLGGANNLRGFYQGRYRDKAIYSAIAEYRTFIYWRISACVFAGVGDVYSKISNINFSTMKASFGGGIRIALLKKEKLNLRLDYGYADNYNQGFYFTIAECF